MLDIAICADYIGCGNTDCFRHAEQYDTTDPQQSWSFFYGTKYCPKWHEANNNSIITPAEAGVGLATVFKHLKGGNQ